MGLRRNFVCYGIELKNSFYLILVSLKIVGPPEFSMGFLGRARQQQAQDLFTSCHRPL